MVMVVIVYGGILGIKVHGDLTSYVLELCVELVPGATWNYSKCVK